MLEVVWHRRSADIPEALWRDCFAPPWEGRFWFSALEAAGIGDQFTFFFGLLRDGGVPVGIVPAFVFDLPLELVLPDAAGRVASRVRSSPLRGLASLRTFFIGNVAGEEGHVGLTERYRLDAVAAEIHEAARRQATALKAGLVVWKDFPESDRAALDALVESRRAFRMPSYPGSIIPLLAGGYERCLASMPAQHRHKMRKRLRRGAEALPMTTSLLTKPSAAELRELFALYGQTYRRGRTKFERFTLEFFADIARFDRTTFIVLRHPQSGRMLAFTMLFDLGERVINQFIGIDYESAQEAYPYFRLFAAAYDWACTTGARVMQSGQTGYMAKLESGHALVPLWNYCEHRNRGVNWIIRRVARRITWHTLDDQLREWLSAHPSALPPSHPAAEAVLSACGKRNERSPYSLRNILLNGSPRIRDRPRPGRRYRRQRASPESHLLLSATRETIAMQDTAGVVNGETNVTEPADTLERVRDLLQERYGIDKHKVEMNAELSALGLDSLSLVEYAFDLEKSLHISLTDLPHELVTIGDLVRYVDQVRRRTGTALAA